MVGLSSSITGSSQSYGGGGTSPYPAASPGIPGGTNTGNGGGGVQLGPTHPGLTAGSGGPGIVVISYVNPVAIATGGTISNTTTGLVPGCIMQVHTFTNPGTFTLNAFTKQTSTYPVTIMVVGGGGSSTRANPPGRIGGGGGGGGVVVGITCVNKNCGYVINSGTGGYNRNSAGRSLIGFPSFFIGSGVSLTGLGGGGGGSGASCLSPPVTPPNTLGKPGGSGGGGGTYPSATSITAAGGTATQPGQGQTVTGTGSTYTNYGFPGGYGGGPPLADGAGGGATRAGFPGNCTTPLQAPGHPGSSGGTGYTFPYTGSIYAGGGNIRTQFPNQNSCGQNGGGGYPSGTGSVGTGAGGGPATWCTATLCFGVGAPGTVIIVVPTPNFPGVAAGATITTPGAAPGKTVLTYNGALGGSGPGIPVPTPFNFVA